jgi:hypothetical protein
MNSKANINLSRAGISVSKWLAGFQTFSGSASPVM